MSLQSLVPDIYALIQKAIDGETVEVKQKVVDDLQAGVGSAFLRLLDGKTKVRPEKTLYASEVGKPCRRQLWYAVHEYKGEDLLPHTKVKFLYGDILESLLLALAEASGHEVTDSQKVIEIPLPNGWKIRGRMDAKIGGVPVDVKSASSYAFKKFKEGTLAEDDAFGYIGQLAMYCEAEEHKGEAGFFAIDKQNGTLVVDSYHATPAWTANAVPDREGLVRDMESKEPPKRGFEAKPDGKSGNMALGVNCSYCVTPDTRILTETLEWKPAHLLSVGEPLLGFDEHPATGKGSRRFYRQALVVEAPRYVLPTVRVITDRGSIVVSADHAFLGRTKAGGPITWMIAKCLVPGSGIRYMSTWNRGQTYEDAWMSGFLDGEGTFHTNRLSFAQRPTPTLTKALSIMESHGFRNLQRYVDKTKGDCLTLRVGGTNDENFRALGIFYPERLISTWFANYSRHSITVRHDGYATVLAVESAGEQEVVGLETSTATYIADGFFSHNCSYKNECWKDANDGKGLLGFAYSNGPRWLTKIVKTPDVPPIGENHERPASA